MSDARRRAIGEVARARVPAEHTADHRAAEFERRHQHGLPHGALRVILEPLRSSAT